MSPFVHCGFTTDSGIALLFALPTSHHCRHAVRLACGASGGQCHAPWTRQVQRRLAACVELQKRHHIHGLA